MKQYILEFLKRGAIAMGGGPIVLAIVYFCSWKSGVIFSLNADEVVKGILSISLMAFIAGGISMIYQIEELPLMYAILIHGIVLYTDYLMIYLLNHWIADSPLPLLFFTAIFIVGYALIWVVIYLCIRAKTQRLNQKLQEINMEEEKSNTVKF